MTAAPVRSSRRAAGRKAPPVLAVPTAPMPVDGAMSVDEAMMVDGVANAACGCAHCGLPVPKGLVRTGEPVQFCCEGCRTVYGLVHACDLSRYYELRDGLSGENGRRAKTTSRDFAELDDPAYTAAHTSPAGPGRRRALLQLDGVHCAACVWLVERLSRVTAGVVESRLDFRRARVSLVWDTGVTSLSRLARALDGLGYPAHPPTSARAEERRRAEDRRWLIRIGVAGALAGNTMLLGLGLYAGLFDGIASGEARMLRLWSAALGVLSLAWPGRVFFQGAIAAVRARTPHLDLPVAVALAAGGVWGTANALRGTGEVYFDSITALVFLLLVGRFVQHAQQRRAVDSLELLERLTPSHARRLDSPDDDAAGARSVPIDALRPGDFIDVRAGDAIAADGVVHAGSSRVDMSVMTGESEPVRVTPGDRVAAGATNLVDRLVVRVEASGAATRLARLMSLVEESLAQRAPVVRAADRLAVWFVVAVAALAVGTAAAWWPHGPGVAIEHAVALLVVTCPCALGLATPLVMTVALGRLTRAGVVVKGAGVLETLSRPGRILLDKTGTLTRATLRAVAASGDDAALRRAAALEEGVNHPVARAVAALRPADTAWRDDAAKVDERRLILGLGVEGVVDGVPMLVGSPTLMSQRGVGVHPAGTADEDVALFVRARLDAGESVVCVAERGRLRAALAVAGDVPHEDTAATIAHLRRRGWRPAVLSGDRPERVEALGQQLGLDAGASLGGQTPEAKVERVRAEMAAAAGAEGRAAPVVMVGDGVNDAAALAAADVGIAVHGGAEASLQAADVYIASPGIAPIATLLAASRGAMRRVRVCMALSIGYNALAAGFAVAGAIHPLLAAVLMPLSSLTVVAVAAWGGTPGGSDRGADRRAESGPEWARASEGRADEAATAAQGAA